MTTDRARTPLHRKILIGMAMGAIAGIAVQTTFGHSNPEIKYWVDEWFKPLGSLFMRLIFMVVIPLLFSALVLGVMELGNARKIGRVGARAFMFTVLLSAIAVCVALVGTNLIRPGAGISEEKRTQLIAQYGSTADAEKSVEKSKEAKGFAATIVEFVPENPIEEAAKPKLGGVLPFMVFAMLFGIALSAVEEEVASPFRRFLEALFAVSQKLIEYAMKIAPYGVFALVFSSFATLGWEAVAALGKYAALVLIILAFHLFVVYSIFLKLFAKRNPLEFFKQVQEVIYTAFGTSSSNATLPVALRVTEEKVGVPRKVGNFVLTVGATANQNGTALFEGVTVLFLAQMFGVQLAVSDQLTVLGLAILAGIGTAGVPGGSWPMIAAICAQVGVPPTAIALCIGIDRILDMSRTVVNVVGDIAIATAVASEENLELEPAV